VASYGGSDPNGGADGCDCGGADVSDPHGGADGVPADDPAPCPYGGGDEYPYGGADVGCPYCGDAVEPVDPDCAAAAGAVCS
jgi:hypothetical protein